MTRLTEPATTISSLIPNFGRGRKIYETDVFVHESVKLRMKKGYQPKAIFGCEDHRVQYVDDFDRNMGKGYVSKGRLVVEATSGQRGVSGENMGEAHVVEGGRSSEQEDAPPEKQAEVPPQKQEEAPLQKQEEAPPQSLLRSLWVSVVTAVRRAFTIGILLMLGRPFRLYVVLTHANERPVPFSASKDPCGVTSGTLFV